MVATAEQLAAAKAMGHDTDLIEVAARWLMDGRCCGRKPHRYQRPSPHLCCFRCNAEYDLDGNQEPSWAWERTDRGTYVSRAWPTAERYREAVAKYGAPSPIRSFQSMPAGAPDEH